MDTLLTIFPDPDVLLDLQPEELAPIVLKLATAERQHSGVFRPDTVYQQMHGNLHDHNSGYQQGKKDFVERAIAEAWNYLQVQGVVIPDTGGNGWFRLSRRGVKLLEDEKAFAHFRQAAAFPKTLLHPHIADAVWLDLARGDYDTAIFRAMKAVEIAVRDAGNFTDADYGVDMIRSAFNSENGPLRDSTQLPAERQALSNFVGGAYGLYKNPGSHRSTNVNDHSEAQEIVMLASHLLRIVDLRRPK